MISGFHSVVTNIVLWETLHLPGRRQPRRRKQQTPPKPNGNIDPQPTRQAANLMLPLLTKEVAKGDYTSVQCVPTQIKYLQYIRLQFNASTRYDFVHDYWSS